MTDQAPYETPTKSLQPVKGEGALFLLLASLHDTVAGIGVSLLGFCDISKMGWDQERMGDRIWLHPWFALTLEWE